MKKTVIITITLCSIQLFCAALVFGQTGTIKELTGTVEIKRSGQTTFIPAKAGDTIAQDTVVSTGFKSSALISVGNSIITVRPLTRLTLAEMSATAGTESINVSLQTGRVRVDVDPPAGSRTNMSVRGPNATASVRGTSFEFDTKNLTVQKGVVAFRGKKGGVMLVSAGSSSRIRADDKVANPIETTAVSLLPPSPVGSGSGFVRGTDSTPGPGYAPGNVPVTDVEFVVGLTFQ